MKKETIKIKLIDHSRFIDSKNGYRINFKDRNYKGYTIVRKNDCWEAQIHGIPQFNEDKEEDLKAYIDEIVEKKSESNKDVPPSYLIITKRRWKKYKEQAIPDRVTKDLEEARYLKSRYENNDGQSFVLINNITWKEVF